MNKDPFMGIESVVVVANSMIEDHELSGVQAATFLIRFCARTGDSMTDYVSIMHQSIVNSLHVRGVR